MRFELTSDIARVTVELTPQPEPKTNQYGDVQAVTDADTDEAINRARAEARHFVDTASGWLESMDTPPRKVLEGT